MLCILGVFLLGTEAGSGLIVVGCVFNGENKSVC